MTFAANYVCVGFSMCVLISVASFGIGFWIFSAMAVYGDGADVSNSGCTAATSATKSFTG